MKKVLIIGHFRPYREGSIRMFGLAKYLKLFNWEPVVITGPLDREPEFNVKYIEVKYPNIFGINSKKDFSDQASDKIKNLPIFFKNFLRWVFNYIKEIFAYPDEYKHWKYPVIKETEKLFEKEKIDAVISVWPVTAHLIAKEIKIKHKIPWIADYPDLWSQNYDYPYSFIRKFFDKKLELKTIKFADELIATSPTFINKLKFLHKDKKAYCILHGFDPDIINDSYFSKNGKFTITYTGQIYKGKQDPLKIIIAIKELIYENKIDKNDIELRFYGTKKDWIEKIILKKNLLGVVNQYGKISREDCIIKQRRSHVLLLFNWEDRRQKFTYPSKIFEYLAARRPILATGGIGEVDLDILKETASGVCVKNIKEIKEIIQKFYYQYKELGDVQYHGDWEKIKKYSQYEMTKKFSERLNQFFKNGE